MGESDTLKLLRVKVELAYKAFLPNPARRITYLFPVNALGASQLQVAPFVGDDNQFRVQILNLSAECTDTRGVGGH
jgi:hypothetical protein